MILTHLRGLAFGDRPSPRRCARNLFLLVYKKATLAGVAVILVVEFRYNCLSEKRIASSTEQLGFCLSTDLSTLSDAVRVNPNIASAAKASS